MRIVFLAPHIKIAGGIRAILMYADLLSRMGHKVFVVVLSNNWLRRNLANILNIKPEWFKNFKARIIRVYSFEEKNIPNYDVVIATSWRTADPVSSFKKGKKFYFIQHYEGLYHGDKNEVDATYKLNLEKIVISSWLKDIMKKEFSSDSHFLITPVDEDLFYFKPELRKEKPLRILILDHKYKWKGTMVGYQVSQKIKREMPNIELVGFGVRREKPDLDYDEYFYNPSQEKLAEIYSSCHIYLCPSEFEGLGMPSMEAMACKCALVTFDNGGSRDYAIDMETAFVARHNDLNDLYVKLKTAILNKELRNRIAENGYRFIKKLPTWEEQARKLENIFKKALNQNA